MTRSNLILTGGINHDFDDAARALMEVLENAGFKSEVQGDINEGLRALADGRFDLLTMFTLRWRMLDDDKYIPFREEWAFELSARQQQVIREHLGRGAGLLGLHTASICFDTWPDWADILGVRWVWGETWHPLPADIAVQTSGLNHPVINDLEPFHVRDEIYHHLQPSPAALPLLQAMSADDGSLQTLAWAKDFGTARVIYDSLGHDRASITAAGHAEFLQRAARWCTGERA